MKRHTIPLFLSLALALTAFPALGADDPSQAVQDAQAALLKMELYHGPVDGVSNAEFRAAVRRFQDSRGFDTTGELTGDTRAALREATESRSNTLVAISPEGSSATPSSSPSPASTPIFQSPQPTVVPPSPVPPSPIMVENDRALLEESEAEEQARHEEPSARHEPEEEPEPSLDVAAFFIDSPFEDAADEEQWRLFERATSVLRRQGLLDGRPDENSAMEEALLRYQSAERLPLSGMLDIPTLGAMRLLQAEFIADENERNPVRVYRGRLPQSTGPGGVVRGIPID